MWFIVRIYAVKIEVGFGVFRLLTGNDSSSPVGASWIHICEFHRRDNVALTFAPFRFAARPTHAVSGFFSERQKYVLLDHRSKCGRWP